MHEAYEDTYAFADLLHAMMAAHPRRHMSTNFRNAKCKTHESLGAQMGDKLWAQRSKGTRSPLEYMIITDLVSVYCSIYIQLYRVPGPMTDMIIYMCNGVHFYAVRTQILLKREVILHND